MCLFSSLGTVLSVASFSLEIMQPARELRACLFFKPQTQGQQCSFGLCAPRAGRGCMDVCPWVCLCFVDLEMVSDSSERWEGSCPYQWLRVGSDQKNKISDTSSRNERVYMLCGLLHTGQWWVFLLIKLLSVNQVLFCHPSLNPYHPTKSPSDGCFKDYWVS